MTMLAACLAYVAASTLLAPLVLTRGRWQVWHPRLALAAWHTVLMTNAGIVVYTVLYALSLAESHSSEPGAGHAHAVLLTLSVWGGLFVVAAVTALFLAHSEPVVRSEYAERERLQEALLGCRHHTETRRGVVVRHLDADDVLACAFRTPEPTVVVTRGLRELLSPSELDAVIEHELAHLVQRHHFALLLALVNTACLPGFRPARRLHQSTKLLVELIADDTAARRCGVTTIASALTKMADHTTDPGVAARAARLTARPPARAGTLLPLRLLRTSSR